MTAQDMVRDRLLIRQALKGNQEAFQLLLDLYWKSIKSLFVQKNLSDTEAEDLALHTFSKAFAKLRQYKPTYAFSTWLFQIANNNFIDHVRRKQRRISTNTIDEVKDELSLVAQTKTRFSPENEMIRIERKEKVRDLLKKLRPQYYKIIVLRYIEEKSYEEIASELNLPMGTVKAKLFRAKRQMAKIFRAHKRFFNG